MNQEINMLGNSNEKKKQNMRFTTVCLREVNQGKL